MNTATAGALPGLNENLATPSSFKRAHTDLPAFLLSQNWISPVTMRAQYFSSFVHWKFLNVSNQINICFSLSRWSWYAALPVVLLFLRKWSDLFTGIGVPNDQVFASRAILQFFYAFARDQTAVPSSILLSTKKLTWTFPGSQIVALGREPELNDVCPFDFATLCQLCSVENLDTIRRRHQEPGSNSILFAIDPTSRWLRKRRHVRTCCTGRFWSWSRV